jgi:hypothetical protein
MHWLAKKNDVMWFQTRESFIMQPLKELFGRGKKGDKYRYKTPNMAYHRRIYIYETNFGKGLETTLFQPTAEVTAFDANLKKPVKITESNATSVERLNSTGNTPGNIAGTGTRLYYKSDTNINDYASSMWGRNSHKDLELSMIVPGQFGTNIGDIVELELVNYNKNSEPEYNLNGLWLITKIVDNIHPPDFFQRITLSRAKFEK